LAVFDAIKDCWIRGETTGLGFSGGGIGGGNADPCLDGEALRSIFRGGSGGSFDDTSSGRDDSD